MQKIKKFLSVMALLVATVLPCVAGGKKLYTLPNGIEVHRVWSRAGITTPGSTSIIAVEPVQGGAMETISQATTPSFLQQFFTPVVEGAGACGASYLRRPDNVRISQKGGGATAGALAESDADANPVVVVDNKPGNGPKQPKPGKGPKPPKKPKKND